MDNKNIILILLVLAFWIFISGSIAKLGTGGSFTGGSSGGGGGSGGGGAF